MDDMKKMFECAVEDMIVTAIEVKSTNFAEGSLNERIEEIFGPCVSTTTISNVTHLSLGGGFNQEWVKEKLSNAFETGLLKDEDVPFIQLELTAIETVPLNLDVLK